MKQELINTWMRNQLANDQILDEVDRLKKLSEECTKNIYLQFTHIHTIRYYNIEKQMPGTLKGLIKLSVKDVENTNLVRSQLKLSAHWIAQRIKSIDDFSAIKGYKNGCIGWIVYMINHEAHHRCKALMKLKNDGTKLSKRLKFDLWNWK